MGTRSWRRERQIKTNAKLVASRLSEREIEAALGGLSVAIPIPPPMGNESEDEMSESLQRPQAIASFTAGEMFVARGFLSDEEWEAVQRARNFAELMSSYIRMAVPPAGSAPRKSPVPAPMAKPKATDWPSPPPWVGELASRARTDSWSWQLASAVVATNRPFGQAVDLVPSDLYRHAQKEFSDLRKPGSGLGTQRRSVEFFNDFISAIIAKLKTREAA